MERKRKDMDMATDHDTVSPIEHDETANLRLALMERWRESCGRVAERFGRRSDIPFYSSALSALAGECADDMGKSARMRELAGAMHVSISSIKDRRRGTHAPSDFEKVEDIACWAHIDVADLLIESGDRTMDEKLTENQLDVLCVLWNQAYDFLDLCEETDHFVWPTTDLRCVPDSILHDIKVNPEDDKSRPPWEIGTEDLFLQTLDVYLRACRRATPYVGESDIFVRLLGLCDIMTETAFGEDDGKWLPDPDMIFDPHEDGYVSPMEAAELKCRKLLDEIRNDLLALRPTAGK